jgi:hypothetical protein
MRGWRLFDKTMKDVFIFESVHRVMKAEKLLKGKGIKLDLIPVPREISSDCGVAIELSEGSETEALSILTENRISILECYTKNALGKFEQRKRDS